MTLRNAVVESKAKLDEYRRKKAEQEEFKKKSLPAREFLQKLRDIDTLRNKVLENKKSALTLKNILNYLVIATHPDKNSFDLTLEECKSILNEAANLELTIKKDDVNNVDLANARAAIYEICTMCLDLLKIVTRDHVIEYLQKHVYRTTQGNVSYQNNDRYQDILPKVDDITKNLTGGFKPLCKIDDNGELCVGTDQSWLRPYLKSACFWEDIMTYADEDDPITELQNEIRKVENFKEALARYLTEKRNLSKEEVEEFLEDPDIILNVKSTKSLCRLKDKEYLFDGFDYLATEHLRSPNCWELLSNRSFVKAIKFSPQQLIVALNSKEITSKPKRKEKSRTSSSASTSSSSSSSSDASTSLLTETNDENINSDDENVTLNDDEKFILQQAKCDYDLTTNSNEWDRLKWKIIKEATAAYSNRKDIHTDLGLTITNKFKEDIEFIVQIFSRDRESNVRLSRYLSIIKREVLDKLEKPISDSGTAHALNCKEALDAINNIIANTVQDTMRKVINAETSENAGHRDRLANHIIPELNEKLISQINRYVCTTDIIDLENNDDINKLVKAASDNEQAKPLAPEASSLHKAVVESNPLMIEAAPSAEKIENPKPYSIPAAPRPSHDEFAIKKPGFFARHWQKIVGIAISGSVLGAGIGAAIGFALIPFTFGISLPLATLIGGVIGGFFAGVTIGSVAGALVGRHVDKVNKKNENAVVLSLEDNDANAKRKNVVGGSTASLGMKVEVGNHVVSGAHASPPETETSSRLLAAGHGSSVVVHTAPGRSFGK